MRMELSWEVKGYLADLIARESLGKLQIIGMRVGIDPETVEVSAHPEVYHGGYDAYPGMNPNEKAALHLIEHTGNPNLLIETVLDMAKREKIGGKWFTKIYVELNSIMERTMQCRMDEELNIIPILDENLQTTEKETYIEKKLEEFGFDKTLANYKSALKTYKTDYKGSISLLRSTFESLVDEIIVSKGEPLKGTRKDRLVQLTNWEIFKKIEKDNEVEHSYRIFGLLSHYGSHTELIAEEEANFLFTSTMAFIWFLINRYEYSDTKR